MKNMTGRPRQHFFSYVKLHVGTRILSMTLEKILDHLPVIEVGEKVPERRSVRYFRP